MSRVSLANRRFRRADLAARSSQAALVREDDRLNSVAQLELHENPLDVGPDSGLLDDQDRRDLAVREAAGDQLEDLALAWGQPLEVGMIGEPGRRLLGHAVYDAPGDGGREQGVTGRDGVHRCDQLLRPGSLEQEARGAGAQAV